MVDSLDAHYNLVVKAITDGRLIPFLGAGANLSSRPSDIDWESGQTRYLPSGSELAAYLAKYSRYPPSETHDLARVSQFIAVMMGTGPLYEELHSLFDADYPPTPLHRFFAALPAVLRDKNYSRIEDPIRRQLLIVTTNYDDLQEQAFKAVSAPFHLVSYVAEGVGSGKFLHSPPDGKVCLIDEPNQYRGLLLDQSPVILKLHGAVDRANKGEDSFVITEDNYIDYLTRTDIASLIPVPLPAKLKKSHLLFLGYGLRDWNLRVILHRIWGSQKLSWKSWAVQLNPNELDQEFWRVRGGESVHQRSFHRAPTATRGQNQYGREGAVYRQRLRRAAVAQPEVRGGVPESIHRWKRRQGRDGRVLSLLQHPAASSGPSLQDASGGVGPRPRPTSR